MVHELECWLTNICHPSSSSLHHRHSPSHIRAGKLAYLKPSGAAGLLELSSDRFRVLNRLLKACGNIVRCEVIVASKVRNLPCWTKTRKSSHLDTLVPHPLSDKDSRKISLAWLGKGGMVSSAKSELGRQCVDPCLGKLLLGIEKNKDASAWINQLEGELCMARLGIHRVASKIPKSNMSPQKGHFSAIDPFVYTEEYPIWGRIDSNSTAFTWVL